MKPIISKIAWVMCFLAVLSAYPIASRAQVPDRISYQAVIRDAQHQLVQDSQIGMRISIVQGAVQGNTVYAEILYPTTNANGLVSIQIGAASGFANIDWSQGPFYIKTEVDPLGGSSFVIQGITQILSVPYAMYAHQSAHADNVPLGNEAGELLYWDGSKWEVLPVGSQGQTLTFCNGVPVWGPCSNMAVVSTTEATLITPHSAQSGGNVISDGGHSVSARGVIWSTLPNPTLNTYNGITHNGQGTGSFTSMLSDLNPETSYYVRAYATNSEGTAYGNSLPFVTLSDDQNGDGYPCPGTPIVTDSDGNTYNTVQIGTQCWMKTNLRTTKYATGVSIPTGLSESEWQNTTSGAYGIFDHEHPMAEGIENAAQMVQAYGKLYNWYAANDPRGLCPAGWHVPDHNEWNTLSSYIATVNSTHIGNQLKSCRQLESPQGEGCDVTDHPLWYLHSTHHGTDDFGFSALPGGMRDFFGIYEFLGFSGYWWSKSQDNYGVYAWSRDLFFNNGNLGSTLTFKMLGMSVRCIKD